MWEPRDRMSQHFLAFPSKLALCPTIPSATTAATICISSRAVVIIGNPGWPAGQPAAPRSVSGRVRRSSPALWLCGGGYVVMPEHIHLLISEPEKCDTSRVMQAIKQGFSRRVLKSVRKRRMAAQQELPAVGAEHVWQRR